ncbi:ABC transporter ATP-binding protein [Paenibacillus tarimensis]|uniref:ABC transporter ATP-binding protein n=1 Tax=Paenibacillus tarimensis TaxID=416012 RepID=UPI001F18C893|nr:ABC transporter ATP-binding protein [Paenibacillus tarimensis]MCF2942393.1 energy-coupling factor ABC transporter ATP-binding protein [Paenibacillus tarimensis]
MTIAESQALQLIDVNVYLSDQADGQGKEGERVHLLSAVTMDIEPSEWIQLVGPNGSGKSTLGMLLAGHSERIAQGNASAEGVMIRGFAGEWPLPVVTQDPEASIVGQTPWEDLILLLEQQGMATDDVFLAAEESLKRCSLWELRDRKVETLSGGQKQLLAAAGCLACGVPLLLFDEADTMLDATSMEAVRSAARELWRNGMTILWISHRLDGLRHTDRVVGMEKGRIVYDGPVEAFYQPGQGTGPSPCTRLGYEPPYSVQAALELNRLGFPLTPLPLSPVMLEEAVRSLGG